MNHVNKGTDEPARRDRKSLVIYSAKWMGGIVLAAVLTLGLAGFIMHLNGPVNVSKLSGSQYGLTLFIVPPVACCLLVLLACAFVPSNKKYAGILVSLLWASFISYGAYEHYNYDSFVANQFKIIYSGFVVGLLAGFVISYIVFKNKNWADA
jgi:hypothetical protein